MITNWQTTVFGSGGILAVGYALYHTISTGAQVTPEEISSLVGIISVGIGLLRAKDKNVTGGTVPQTAEAVGRADSPTLK